MSCSSWLAQSRRTLTRSMVPGCSGKLLTSFFSTSGYVDRSCLVTGCSLLLRPEHPECSLRNKLSVAATWYARDSEVADAAMTGRRRTREQRVSPSGRYILLHTPIFAPTPLPIQPIVPLWSNDATPCQACMVFALFTRATMTISKMPVAHLPDRFATDITIMCAGSVVASAIIMIVRVCSVIIRALASRPEETNYIAFMGCVWPYAPVEHQCLWRMSCAIWMHGS